MTDRRVECDVVVPTSQAIGEFSNAFRVVLDSGTEWFLDFLVYSESEKVAKLVSRVRVQESFLLAVYERLGGVLHCIIDERTKAQLEGTQFISLPKIEKEGLN